MITYDELWTAFLSINETDDINLPNTDEKIYDVIHSAIRHYNTRLGESLTYDDNSEQINSVLKDWKLILLAHYIRLSFIENKLIHLSTTFSPFQKDIGIKNYQEMSRNFKDLISREDNKIETIIINNYSEDYM